MKHKLLTSVAFSAMLAGAAITAPVLTSDFVGKAQAQDTTTPEILPGDDTDAPDDDADPEGTAPDATTDDTGTDPATQDDEVEGVDEDTMDTPPTDDPATDDPITDDPATDDTLTDDPATDDPLTDDPATDEPLTDDPATDDAATDDPLTDDAAAIDEPVEEFLAQQEQDEVSANTYIGQSLYNMADENIGTISDLIFTKDGGVTTAIVGVGGFLGIGQKNVGVNFELIDIQDEPDSADVRLVIDATQEELENAPDYQTLDDQLAEQAQPMAPAGDAPMTPAPPPAQ